MLDNRPISRLDDTSQVVQKKLESVLEYADKEICGPIVLQAGDLCDVPRSWGVMDRLAGALRERVLREKEDERLWFWTVFGQHDLYMGSWETRSRTTVGLLSRVGLLDILSNEPRVVKNCGFAVWGASYGESVPEVDGFNEYCRILVIHKRIAPDPSWYGDTDYIDARTFLRKNPDFDLVLCGDAHQTFIYQEEGKRGKRTICNTGPLLRREATEQMFSHKPSFFVYDTDSRDIVDVVLVPCVPAGEVLSRENYQKQSKVRLDEFIGKLSEMRAAGVGFSLMDNLLCYMDENDVSGELRELVLKIVGEDKSGSR